MVKTQYLLESERNLWEIDELEYDRRNMLDIALNNHILGKDKKTGRYYLIKEQQIVLNGYFEFLLSQKARIKSARTVLNKIQNITLLAKTIQKPFSEVKKEEIIHYFASLQTCRKPLKAQSIMLKQLHAREFFRWVHNDNNTSVVSWIRGTLKPCKKIDQAQLLTPSDIKRIVEATGNARDACMIMLTYECGLRLGEVSGIKIKNMRCTDNGFIIKVSGKTGEREAFVIDTEPYIREWLNQHPYRNNPEAPLFINFSKSEYGRQLLRSGISRIISLSAKKSGINKKVHPHLLRHSILDRLGKQGFKERDLRIFAGWSGDSKMPDTYLHYGSEEVHKKLLELKGKTKPEDKIKEEQENKQLEPKTCNRCNKINPATALYCNCGLALDKLKWIEDTERREKADEKLNELFADAEFKELVKQYLAKKSIK